MPDESRKIQSEAKKAQRQKTIDEQWEAEMKQTEVLKKQGWSPLYVLPKHAKKRIKIKSMLEPIRVMLPEGTFTMFYLFFTVGVVAKIYYYNDVEKNNRNMGGLTTTRVVHDYGVILKNGIELRHLKSKYLTPLSAPIQERRERDVSYRAWRD